MLIAHADRLALEIATVPKDQGCKLLAVLHSISMSLLSHCCHRPQDMSLTTQPVSMPLLNGLMSSPLPAERVN